MQRQDIQLRKLAKSGDLEAQLRLGVAYLAGGPSMQRNVQVGLDYLAEAAVQSPRAAAVCVARNLTPLEILRYNQEIALALAAEQEDVARLKLAAISLIRGESDLGFDLLRRCGDPIARCAVPTRSKGGLEKEIAIALQSIDAMLPLSIVDLVAYESAASLDRGDVSKSITAIRALPQRMTELPAQAYQLVVRTVKLAEESGRSVEGLSRTLIEESLVRCVATGDSYAAHALGRALAGIPCGNLAPGHLVRRTNLRKSTALLLRAGDGGVVQAWLDLHRVCADFRTSVSNAPLARFCLEKAAQSGSAEAERKLGAIELKEAASVEAMERAVALLFSASEKGDSHASRLLRQR